MMEKKTLVHFVEWRKIGDEELERTLNEVRSWGVTDIVAHPVWGLADQLKKGRLKEIAQMIASADLRTPACHAFWGPRFDLGCPDETRRSEAMKEHRDFLYGLAPMGVKTYTLHLGMAEGGDWGQIRKSVEELLPAAEETSIILALENGSEPVEELRRLAAFARKYNHPQIGFCFDTGHANCYSTLGLFPTLELMKPDIVTCHMHDNYGSFDDHNPPGGGNTDWEKLIPELKSCPRLLHAETESGDWSQSSWKQFLRVMPPGGR